MLTVNLQKTRQGNLAAVEAMWVDDMALLAATEAMEAPSPWRCTLLSEAEEW